MALSQDFIEQTGIDDAQVREFNTFIESNKLDETQETALQAKIISMTANIKKSYDGKANEQAEGILSGAAKLITEKTGVIRNQGEKLADFLHRSGGDFFSKKEQSLMQKEKDLEEKIKNGDVSEITKKKLEETQEKLDALQQKEASIDEIISGDYKTKYENLIKENSTLLLNNAFNSIKPTFPKEVNEYETKAKWDEFKSEVLAKYDVELNKSNEYVGIDKENKHRIVKLSDLVKSDEKIVELTKGRQQTGLNHKPLSTKDIDGIPFPVPQQGSEDIQKAIRDYLLNERKLPFHSKQYADEYAKWNVEIKKKQQETA